MGVSKEELVRRIECARKKLNGSIESRQSYETIYRDSVELDRLIEQYIVSEC
ncbi:MAG: Spo0E family sporulation regulatory protein-aspartic acid phosphatase [Lachnospiraceae bacterium]|nr:Spo0E family sporulation regulatory protein-aspartic acid phosphatase [Lachnospiraceae bacterium]